MVSLKVPNKISQMGVKLALNTAISFWSSNRKKLGLTADKAYCFDLLDPTN